MSILDVAAPLIEKLLSFIPDPQMKAKAQLDLFLANQAGEFKQIDAELASNKAQTDINLEDAKGTGFKANARPFMMWVGGVGCAYQWVFLPALGFGYTLWTGHGLPVQPPNMDPNLMIMIGGLMGIHIGARSYEKAKGVA